MWLCLFTVFTAVGNWAGTQELGGHTGKGITQWQDKYLLSDPNTHLLNALSHWGEHPLFKQADCRPLQSCMTQQGWECEFQRISFSMVCACPVRPNFHPDRKMLSSFQAWASVEACVGDRQARSSCGHEPSQLISGERPFL